jgi:hypothetical protein
VGMTRKTAEYIAYKAHVECLGRKPTKADLDLRAGQVQDETKGPAWVYATLYESGEAAAFRTKRGW